MLTIVAAAAAAAEDAADTVTVWSPAELGLIGVLVTAIIGYTWFLLRNQKKNQDAERAERAAMREESRADGAATRVVLDKVADSLSSVGEQLAASREQSRADQEGCVRAQGVLSAAAARVGGAATRVEGAAARIETIVSLKGDRS